MKTRQRYSPLLQQKLSPKYPLNTTSAGTHRKGVHVHARIAFAGERSKVARRGKVVEADLSCQSH